MTRRWALAAMLAIVPLTGLATGCGGGNGGSRAPVAVYATDNFDSAYSQVWATVRKVELIDAFSSAYTVFEDPAGRQIDVAGLAGSTAGSMYAFLGTVDLEARNYAKVRVTMDPTMTVVPSGGDAGIVYELDDTLPKDKSGRVQMTFDMDSPRALGGDVAGDVVIDFDLAKFDLVHGRIVPFLGEGSRTDLAKSANHAPFDYHGSVSDLAGSEGSLTFAIKENGRSVKVVTDEDTIMLHREADTVRAIANGARVEVYGTYDPQVRRLRARSVKIEDPSNETLYPNEIRGIALCENTTNKTVSVQIDRSEGFRPEHGKTTVSLPAGVLLQGPDGTAYATVDAFLAALDKDTAVDVEGVWNRTDNTFAAKRIQIVSQSVVPGT